MSHRSESRASSSPSPLPSLAGTAELGEDHSALPISSRPAFITLRGQRYKIVDLTTGRQVHVSAERMETFQRNARTAEILGRNILSPQPGLRYLESAAFEGRAKVLTRQGGFSTLREAQEGRREDALPYNGATKVVPDVLRAVNAHLTDRVGVRALGSRQFEPGTFEVTHSEGMSTVFDLFNPADFILPPQDPSLGSASFGQTAFSGQFGFDPSSMHGEVPFTGSPSSSGRSTPRSPSPHERTPLLRHPQRQYSGRSRARSLEDREVAHLTRGGHREDRMFDFSPITTQGSTPEPWGGSHAPAFSPVPSVGERRSSAGRKGALDFSYPYPSSGEEHQALPPMDSGVYFAVPLSEHSQHRAPETRQPPSPVPLGSRSTTPERTLAWIDQQAQRHRPPVGHREEESGPPLTPFMRAYQAGEREAAEQREARGRDRRARGLSQPRATQGPRILDDEEYDREIMSARARQAPVSHAREEPATMSWREHYRHPLDAQLLDLRKKFGDKYCSTMEELYRTSGTPLTGDAYKIGFISFLEQPVRQPVE